jgi:hypothetical protein
MTQARSDRRRAPSRPTRDPDYVPSERPAPNGFWPGPFSVCGRCAALIPATERAHQLHRAHHETVLGLEQRGPR